MPETIELIDRAEVRDGQAIVAYTRTEAAIAELRQKYAGATYDLTTTAGDKAARGARLELVTLRGSLEKKRRELKAPALEFGKKIDSEAARLTGEIQALETPIDAQIKADEKRRDDERRAREEAEAARKKVHTEGIARISGYLGLAADLPAARIATGIAYLQGLDLSGFEEFTEEATQTRDRTVAGLQALHAKALAREAEDARLKAEREEQTRIAAEQAETARQLREQQEALDRQRAELEEAQREREAAERRQREEQEAAAAERRRQEEWLAGAEEREQRRQAEIAGAALMQRQEEALRVAGAAGAGPDPEVVKPSTVVQMPAKHAGPPTLKLGEIKSRITPLDIDAAGLAALGFPPVGREGAAKMYREEDYPAMVDQMVATLVRSKLKQQRAA